MHFLTSWYMISSKKKIKHVTQRKIASLVIFTCSDSTTETKEKGVKCIQS